MITREQDFREVRRLLGDPLERQPGPDLIVSNMIAAEQFMTNRLSNTGKPWTHNTLNVAGVIGQAEYTIAPAINSASSFGKALFVYRALGGTILPIPHTDFGTEFQDQRYQFWVAAPANEPYLVSGEKVAFFRNASGVQMRIYPAPTDVHTYTIVYASGSLDWELFEWSDTPAIPEFSRYRQILAALSSIAKCEWEGMSRQENAEYRRELRGDLVREHDMHEAEFRVFIRNPQQEPSISEVGYWWE